MMWSDRATVDDHLGFSSYVETLYSIVLEEDIAPVTVGIFGDWGSGKTSLMRMLESRLGQDRPDVLTVWFNPWQYENKDEVQTALIHSILDVLENSKTLVDDAKQALEKLKKNASLLKLAKFITKTAITMTPDFAGLLDCFADPDNKLATTMRGFNKEFADYLELLRVKRLVIFIDDLDRCEAPRALELFETIQLFLASNRCAFIIGADVEKIKSAIQGRFGMPDDDRVHHDYLEKVIQVPFRIPAQSPVDIEIYLYILAMLPGINPVYHGLFKKELLDSRGVSDLGGIVNQWMSDHQEMLLKPLAELQADVSCLIPHRATIIQGLKGNPRQIKRFLNIYHLRRTLAAYNKLEIDDQMMVKLLVMEYTWPSIFEETVKSYDDSDQTCIVLESLYEIFDKGSDDKESALITALAETPGLKDYLCQDPQLRNVQLGPYLFLAQTSLAAPVRNTIISTHETVGEAVKLITSGDKIKAKIGVSKAIALDISSLDVLVGQCLPRIFDRDTSVAVYTANSLTDLVVRHPANAPKIVHAIHSSGSHVRTTSAATKLSLQALLRACKVNTQDEALHQLIDVANGLASARNL